MTAGVKMLVAGAGLALLAGLSIYGSYRLGQQAGVWSPADEVVVHDADLAATLMVAAGDQRVDDVIILLADNVVSSIRALRASTSPRHGQAAKSAEVERSRLSAALTEASQWATSDEARKALAAAHAELSSL